MLIEGERQLRERGVTLWLSALNPEALEMIRRTPLADSLGRERMFFTIEDAVAAYERRADGKGKKVPEALNGHPS